MEVVCSTVLYYILSSSSSSSSIGSSGVSTGVLYYIINF